MLVGDNEERIPATGPLAPIKNWWADLPPKKQKVAILALMVLLIGALSLMGYKSRHSGTTQAPPPKKVEAKEIALNPDLFEKSMYTQAQLAMDQQQKALAGMQEQIERLKAQAAAQELQPDPQTRSSLQSIPPPPVPAGAATPNPYTLPPPPPSFNNPQDRNSTETIGGIVQVKNSSPAPPPEDDSKKNFKIYLPPSFMEATLLSGLDAPTSTSGKNEPVPVLLRIRDLAVLPNRVKANLKGCFALGEGRGNLASERVDVRLLTLSCVSRNGESVIDQAVKGYVVDGDGKAGLRGDVTAKMGTMLARTALAGFLGGVGQAVQASSINYQQTPYGTQQIWSDNDTTTVIKGGIGGGISEPAQQFEKFYLELAQQTLPIIQVGATKIVTVVVSDGLNLEGKNEALIN